MQSEKCDQHSARGVSTWRDDMKMMCRVHDQTQSDMKSVGQPSFNRDADADYSTVETDDERAAAPAWQLALNYSQSLLASFRSRQQRKRSQRTSTSSPGRMEMRSMQSELEFNDMPMDVRWQIFTYLDSHSLCQAAMVCRSWYFTAGDELLWKRLLNRDVSNWSIVGHHTHPSIFTEAASDLPTKEIYLRCHPQASKYFNSQVSAATPSPWKLVLRLPTWFKRPVRVAMFGPGLESLPVARKLVFNSDALFKPTGMTPGHEGVGSGVSIRHLDHQVNLMILYKATKAERTRLSAIDEINRLISAPLNAASGEPGAGSQNAIPKAELTARVKDMCQSVDAFICVVDNNKAVKQSTAPLIHAVMDAGNVTTRERPTPLLVMAATEAPEDQRHAGVVEVASSLSLTRLAQPWRAQHVSLDDPVSMIGSIDWLLKQL